MTKPCWLIVVALAVGCGDTVDLKSCKITCATDADCPAGLACGDLGLCAADGETCSCTAGEFIACNGDGAVYCNAQANGTMTQECGAPSCNADAGRCNACVPNDTACSLDQATLDHCGADGLVAQSDACAAGCVAATMAGELDRCAHVEAAWLPDVCTFRAAMPDATLGGTLDVEQDAACTGGVVTVNGTTFCVVRAGTIEIGTLKVTGTRAVAFVADEELTVTGTVDVSADGTTSGPGAGGLGAGTSTIGASYLGAGGAGFAQAGGAGGGNNAGTLAGAAGGAVTDRLTTARFFGGAPGGGSECGDGMFACINSIDFVGGGGGGGALLIACRGTVRVSGIVDAGGGGGQGGGDHYTDTNSIGQGGSPGGGSGGFVAFQGVNVEITGKLYANGGGGGGGAAGDNNMGPAGADGLLSTTGALGGDPVGDYSTGGIGGSVSSTPGTGVRPFADAAAGAGGGGGAMGRFEVFTPSGVAPTLTPAEASPAPFASSISLLVK